MFFSVVRSHRDLGLGFFFMAGPRSAAYSKHLWPKSPRKIVIRVLERYVRLVAITATSPKAVVAAGKLVPGEGRIGSWGFKKITEATYHSWVLYWLVLLV